MKLIKAFLFNSGICAIDSDIADIAVAGATSAASSSSEAQNAAEEAVEAAKDAEIAAQTAFDIVDNVAEQTAREMYEALVPIIEEIRIKIENLQTQIDEIKLVQTVPQNIVNVEPEPQPEIVVEIIDNKDDGLIVADEINTHTPPQDRRKRYKRI